MSISAELSKHLSDIGREGGRKFKPGRERMIELARLSWSEKAREKRVAKHTNKVCSTAK